MQKAAAVVALLVAAALVATVESGFYFTEDDLKSEEALWDLYGRWAAHHGVVRQPGRFAAFKANAEDRHAQQRRHGGKLMALNVFGDSSFDELEATPCFECASPCTPKLGTKVIDLEMLAATRGAIPTPSKVDWRAENPTAVTEVKRQRGCGSCWAFATAAAVEGVHSIKMQTAAVSLSPQFLLDCTTPYMHHPSGCRGGSIFEALNLIKKLGGIPSDSNYPYLAYQWVCDHHKFHWSATISDWFEIQSDAAKLRVAVSLQPVMVGIGIDKDFRLYDPKINGPVYYGPGNTTLSHAVLIVGYDVDDLGLPYWIVKNSWGTGWGDNGYVNINANANDKHIGPMGVAGILTSPVFIEV